jgi:zinc protease
LFSAHRDTQTGKRPAIKTPAISKPVKSVVTKGKAQSHIFYGWQVVGENHEDRYALEVMNAITTGMGGRLFLQIRDKQSLAYSVASIMPLRDEAGSYLVYLASAPDKVDEAVAAIEDQIGLLRDKGVSEREVEEAKRFLIGNLAVDRQSNGARANGQVSGELDGKGFRFESEVYPQKIEAVTVEDVNRVARKYLKPDEHIFVLVK